MKLRSSLRKHYAYKNSRWVAKKKFNSRKEILDEGFSSDKWKPYYCDICESLHIADLKKVNS